MSLSRAEVRLLKALPADGEPAAAADVARKAGFQREAEALQAADAPIRAGLVVQDEESARLVALTPEGRRIHGAGLPEERAMRVLTKPMPVAALAQAAGLSPGEAKVIVGLLRRTGWADVLKGPEGPTLVPKGRPAAYALGGVFAALSDQPQAVPVSDHVESLVERGLATVVEARTRRLRLTAAGRQALAELGDQQGVVEVNQVTPDLVTRWATMGPEEKAAHHLRPFDLSVPVAPHFPGKAHPLSQMLSEIRANFWRMGFQEIAGDYVESAYWNMDALFIPQDHPAREMQDTFYLAQPATIPVAERDLDRGAAVHESGGGTGSTGWGGSFDRAVAQKALLRTHTTNTTVRYLAEHFGHHAKPGGPATQRPGPPASDSRPTDVAARAAAQVRSRNGPALPYPPTSSPTPEAHKVFGLGRVFRKETMDATHLPEFTQIEGIVVEPGATFNTLVGLCRHFFAQIGFPEVRFRPAYFPYTEPSMEIEVRYNGRWMELGGCGVFRPEVTKPLGVPHNVLAWGFGLERLAMMRLGLKDIRDLYVSDVQWLRETPLQ